MSGSDKHDKPLTGNVNSSSNTQPLRVNKVYPDGSSLVIDSGTTIVSGSGGKAALINGKLHVILPR
jgi:hypothetical protein